ncbi:hypothetical protein CAPTEDRAFT_197682 [Capitella teleta]|uniref:ABC transmembrane type-1 domain-containing protein n=1 Tax=Capitella teleta TaxID=283909 RepID=R7VL84_CAPTE|nr:hypothetical protein CAPTEDRAFT_197682 [Capitella teleta]|eukprot:ELU18041.1 hypothetical protein CAPTEDRAFT_197682 [Capitella teleta]
MDSSTGEDLSMESAAIPSQAGNTDDINNRIDQEKMKPKTDGFVDINIVEDPPEYAPECSEGGSDQNVEVKTKSKGKMVGPLELFKYSDKRDVLMMVVGTIASIAFGCGYPINLIIYGDMIDLFLANDYSKAM